MLVALILRLTRYTDPDRRRSTLASVAWRVRATERTWEASVGGQKSAWERAIKSIADGRECPLYGGLKIQPQVGLLPIGRNPRTRLWEFAHLLSGDPARLGSDRKLQLTDRTGMVFVLIPGGRFFMGSVPGNRRSRRDEKPRHAIRLHPFFLSKYEMTQGQWKLLTGEMPSRFKAPRLLSNGELITLLNPVESISWVRCRKVLIRLGLTWPTEAQWEYAARARTRTIWWSGSDVRSLQGTCNIADLQAKRSVPAWTCTIEVDDGYTIHCPIGRFRPNPFGLHDVIGNVHEWVRDGYYRYNTVQPRDGDGERVRQDAAPSERVRRGGSYTHDAVAARHAFRYPGKPDGTSNAVGVRAARAIE